MFTCTQATSDGIHWGDPSFLASLGALSYAFHWRTPSTFVNDYRILGQWGSTAARSNALICVGTTGTFRWYTYSDSATKFARECNTDLSASTLHRVVCTYDETLANADAMDFYWNGASKGDALVSSWSQAPAPLNNGNGDFYLGRAENANASPGGDFGEFACWNRKLTAAEALAVSNGAAPTLFPAGLLFYAPLRNLSEKRDIIGGLAGTEVGTLEDAPHGFVFYPAPVFYSFPAAGAAAIERSPTAGTLTLTGESPAVALALQFSPSAGDLTLTGESAQVGVATDVAPTAGDLTLTGESPSVATKLDVSPSAQTLTLSGESPSVALALQFSPTAGDLTLTGEDPAVLVSSATDISPTAGTLTLTGESPSVALALQISPAAGDLTLTGEDPSVLVSAAGDISPTAGTLTLTGESAAVALALQFSPTAGDLTLTSTDPSVSVQRNIAPSAQTLTLTGESATVALNLVISPTAGTLTLGGSTADIVNTGFVPAPTPEPTGDGGGAGEARGITEYGRRRQRREQKIGPAIYGPTIPEEEEAPVISSQAREAAPPEATEEDLIEIQRALDRGEKQLSLLGDRMDEMEENLQELASRRRSSLLLLLAMTEEIF